MRASGNSTVCSSAGLSTPTRTCPLSTSSVALLYFTADSTHGLAMRTSDFGPSLRTCTSPPGACAAPSRAPQVTASASQNQQLSHRMLLLIGLLLLTDSG